MLIAFIVCLILLAAAIGFRIVTGDRGASVAIGFFSVLAVLAFVFASASVVPTRNVGIVTEFSKPTDRTTGAGLKWHAPWQSIDDWDASGQTYSHLGDGCVWVTIAAQRRSCIPVQIEWSAKSNRAPENWAAYKEVGDLTRFETFVVRRVDPQINAAMTSVFASFDPLKVVNATTGDAPAPDLNASYRQPLIDALNRALGEDIEIRSVAFEAPRYDQPTTDAINQYGQKVLEARNLQVDETNAVTRARIEGINAKVDAQSRCLTIAEKLGKEPGLCMTPTVATRPVG